MKLSKVARVLWKNGAALAWLVIFGLIGWWVYGTPAAITLPELLVVVAVLAWPLYVLAQERGAHWHTHTDRRQIVTEIGLFGGLAAGVAYANYLWFFSRAELSPVHIDTNHPLYLQATTLASLTLTLCLLLNLFFARADHRKKVWDRHLWRNQKLWRVIGISLFGLLVIIYGPWPQALLGTAALGLMDWLAAIVFAAIYTACRLLQRRSRHYTRHAVLKLHHQVHGHQHKVIH